MTDNKHYDKVGPGELSIMIVFVSLSHLLWIKTNRMHDLPGQSAWISALLSCALGLIIAFAVLHFIKGKGLVFALIGSYGKVLGNIVAGFFALYFLIMASALLGRMELEMGYYSYTATDKTIMRVFFGIAMMFIACCGIAGVSRTARFAIVLVIASLGLMFFFSVKRFDISNLYPILGAGPLPTLAASLEITSAYWSIFAIATLGAHTGGQHPGKKGIVKGVILSSLLIAGTHLVMLGSIANPLYRQVVSPLLYFASTLHAGKFVGRIDSLFISAWISLAVIVGAFGIQSFAHILCDLTGTKTVKPYCVGGAGLMLVTSSQLQFSTSLTELFKLLWIPALALIVIGDIILRIRRKNEKA